jgi:hypothetical protein
MLGRSELCLLSQVAVCRRKPNLLRRSGGGCDCRGWSFRRPRRTLERLRDKHGRHVHGGKSFRGESAAAVLASAHRRGSDWRGNRRQLGRSDHSCWSVAWLLVRDSGGRPSGGRCLRVGDSWIARLPPTPTFSAPAPSTPSSWRVLGARRSRLRLWHWSRLWLATFAPIMVPQALAGLCLGVGDVPAMYLAFGAYGLSRGLAPIAAIWLQPSPSVLGGVIDRTFDRLRVATGLLVLVAAASTTIRVP